MRQSAWLRVANDQLESLPSPLSSGVIGLSAAQATERPITKQAKSGGPRTSDVDHRAWLGAVAVVFLAAIAQGTGRHA